MAWLTNKTIIIALVTGAVSIFSGSFDKIAESAQEPAQAPSQLSKLKMADIESIATSGEGSAVELVIKLSAPATYTSYKTTSPLRLVIDLSQVTPGKVVSPIGINKANFKTVSVNRYETEAGILTRLEIELVNDVEAVLSASPERPGELRISFPADSATTASASMKADLRSSEEKSVNKDAADAGTAALPVSKTEIEKPPVVNSPASAPLATPKIGTETALISKQRTLSSISVGDNSIALSIDGGDTEFKSFRLNKPERFVVDLYDVKSILPSRIIPIKSKGISTARLGLYPDKVRVVFDSINGSFPEASASKTATGISISLSGKQPVQNPNTQLTAISAQKKTDTVTVPDEKPVQAAQVAVPAEEPSIVRSKKSVSTGHASVDMIDFQVIDGVSRVSVKLSGGVEVKAPVVSAGFVTLNISNCVLPRQLQRSIESKGFVSPVLRVTPVLIKTRKGSDTKIRIAMRKTVPHEFRQEGDMVYIDFKTPEGFETVKVAHAPRAKSLRAYAGKKSGLISNDLAGESDLISDEPVKASSTGKMYKGRKVTLEFADAEVRKIFQLLSEVSNKNFVLGDDVTGAISIKLVNVPWDQALDIILDTKGLDKREEGNIIVIKGKGKFKSQAEEDLEIKKQKYKAAELKSESFNVNYAEIKDIVTQFNALKTERGTVSPDERTNKVFVKDIPQIIEDMRRLLVLLDVPERQVMIEARIVEATSTFVRSLGVSWGIHYRDGSASFMGINSLDYGFGGLTSIAPPTTGTNTTAGSSMGISFGSITSNIQLDMRLNAAASAGLIKIVSSPKVATLNNKTAKISQGQQIPYQNTTATTGAVTQFVAAVLSLEVTPHINANGTIGMKIIAKNDAPGASTGAIPPINTKSATTELLMKDGETTVIGGIYVDNETDSDDGVPFLMDIPLIGSLFKTNRKAKTKTELLIFITPRILGNI